MITASDFLVVIEEAAGRLVKTIGIRDGKKQVITHKEYTTELPDGYKRDEDGKPVRMEPEERRNRSKAASKAANKSSTKINKATSDRRRKALVKD